MPRDFYPRPEAKIVSFTANISEKINSAPSDYGIPPQRAADYSLLQQAFAAAYYAVHDNGSNCSSAYLAKETARIALEKETRMVVGCIRGQMSVSDEMRMGLGLRPRAVRRGHVLPPDAPPRLRIIDTTRTSVRIKLTDAESLRKGAPRDVAGAMICAFVGEDPPANLGQCKLRRQSSNTDVTITFDAALPPGTKVWLTAYWYTRRGEPGPACTAVSAHLGFGVTIPGGNLKRAA